MTTPSDDWVHEVAVDAYIYLYPLVTMELTRRQMTNAESPSGTHAPHNTFVHVRAFPPGSFREIVRPNFDTLYSLAWLDLSSGPMVVSAAEGDEARFYQLPMYDMWSDCFAAPGSRTSSVGAGAWAVVPPGWTGELPAGLDRIDAPTPTVWVIGRTQTNGPADYERVHAFQDGLAVTPLASWGGEVPPVLGTVDPEVDMTTPTLEQVNGMDVAAYFDLGLEVLAAQGPHLTDGPLLMQMDRAGLGAGASFAALAPSTQAALADVPGAALAAMAARRPLMARVVNGWQMNIDTMGVYGNSYAKRAIVAMVGLGANSPEDAVYPLGMADADGDPFDGGTDYVLHFDADVLPPVDAFWSLTMYDGQGFQIPNQLDRFAIGDRDPLQFNDDGSLDLYLHQQSPGAGLESNWLPSAPGPLGLTLRLYAPRPTVLDGSWNPPAVRKAATTH